VSKLNLTKEKKLSPKNLNNSNFTEGNSKIIESPNYHIVFIKEGLFLEDNSEGNLYYSCYKVMKNTGERTKIELPSYIKN